jgi:DNA mismatch repair protein MutS
MADATTPMMQQYRRARADLPSDTILLFRLGDFYEMFFEDAQVAAPLLDIALTRRNGMPMCGVPFHAVDLYVAKLVRAGKKVALCDQMEDPSVSRGIVRREVTRIVTAGTVTGTELLDAGRNNYLAGVCAAGGVYGLALLDVSTGVFWGEEAASAEALRESLARVGPSECVVPEGRERDAEVRAAVERAGGQVTACEGWTFEYDSAYDTLKRHLGVHSLEGFGCEGRAAVVGAAGAVLRYVREDLRCRVEHVRSFGLRRGADFLVLDEATCAHLDLTGSRGRGGLLQVLDVTRTAMGARRLREWLLRPLADVAAIRQRHDAVERLCRDRPRRAELAAALDGVRDLERLVARINASGGNARDLLAVGQSLAALPAVKERLRGETEGLLAGLDRGIRPLPELAGLIGRAIAEAPPATVKEGGMIRPGYRPDLDELRGAATAGRQWLAEYQASEQQRTVFGYYIEVSKGQAGNVPADYARKQTLVGAERFITPELKQYETRVFGAQERAVELEYEIFLQVRDAVLAETAGIQSAADAVGQLDALTALADRADALGYTRPTVNDAGTIRIRGGRHPVVERMPDAERFVPNDALLDASDNQIIIITGPNMAGKSTYIRQVALIVIMAQMGSFVPAEESEIGVVDRVFTRVGASDDLARGRSTFMVEMQETANILNNATPASLVVLDEIGRGTSTFDGISIAWAVAEFLHNNPRVRAKTLFATHYHELTDLALTLKGVKNYNVLVREKGERVVFLRKIVPGGSDKSYGIQVARLAGMPPEVIDRAAEILANLEEGEIGEAGQPRLARERPRKGRYDPAQLPLFGS